MPAFYTTPQARRLAYHKTAGASPNLVFLGGFKSDMQGSKALFLESCAQQRGFSYLRFELLLEFSQVFQLDPYEFLKLYVAHQ